MILYMIIIQVIKYNNCYKVVIHVTVTDHTEKSVKSFKTNDIIQYSNSMLVL